MSNSAASSKKQKGGKGRFGLVQDALTGVLAPRLLLIFSTFALLIFGLIMVYSASFVEAFADPNIADSSFFIKRQAMMAVIGLIFMVGAVAISYRFWNTPLAWLVWLFVVVLLVATLLFAEEINGGKRWIEILGQSFQASEFAKIAIILLASSLAIKLREAKNITPSILALAVVIGLPIILVMLQPDLGTTLIIFAGIIAIAWFGELSMKPLAIAGLLVLVIAASGVLLSGFRMDRIDAWLDPFSHASTTGYQIVNSFYAFAGGGVDGVGLGMSHQKYLYLPEPYNDLIFPIIGEEFGLLGTISVVLLFLTFLFAAFRIAKDAPDIYGRMVAGSAATVIGAQAFLNMLCMVNILPMTGKPLPFFSYGGSSIIATLILTGLILNVSFRTQSEQSPSQRREQLKIFEGGKRGLIDNATGLAYTVASTNSSRSAGARSALASTSARHPKELSSGQLSGLTFRSTDMGLARRGKTTKGKGNKAGGADIITLQNESFLGSGLSWRDDYAARQAGRAGANPALMLSPARNVAAAKTCSGLRNKVQPVGAAVGRRR